MLKACSDKGVHPLSSGRRGPHLIARLRELSAHLKSLGMSTFAYPRGSLLSKEVPHSTEGPEALKPYRDADPDRLKISGKGQWDLAEFLSAELRLPFLEPRVLRAIPHNSLPYPAALEEDPDRTLRMLKLWDSRGLLYLSFERKAPRELTRVFGCYKNESADRQIGDRRGCNGLEGRLQGPSRFLPPGHCLVNLTVPAGCRLVGASTDRADFYHQAAVSAAKAEGNTVGPPFRVKDFEGWATLEQARAIVGSRSFLGQPNLLRSALREARLVSPGVPPSLLFDPEVSVHGSFRSLYQGDHAGVEFATEAHSSLLRCHHLLDSSRQLLAKSAISREGPWEGLIIDDYFSLSVEEKEVDPAESKAADLVARAREAYDSAGVLGSPHKDVNGAFLFQAAGAQVDATDGPVQDGKVFVSAPTSKLLALAYISLKAASLPVITEEFASNLAGSWISALMFRRCLFSVLDGFFALGKSEASSTSGSRLKFLPQKGAQELVILASLCPVMVSNVAADFCDRLFCSDASMARGAFCVSSAPVDLTAALWLSADKRGTTPALMALPPALLFLTKRSRSFLV